MKRILNSLIFVSTFLGLILVSSSAVQAAWYRGNTHSHFQSMDPAVFRDWYRNAGYDFIAGGDHDTNMSCSEQENLSLSGFLVLCGSELSDISHTLAFGTNYLITRYSSLQDAVDQVIAAGGVPILNHPSLSASGFLGINGLNHFEVANGSRMGRIPDYEAFWDAVLSASNSRAAYAVGSDDNHSNQSRVGTAWIMVQANALTKQEILSNFRNGNFYASTGVSLSDYQVDYSAKTISISADGNTITFIGENGATLQTVSGSQASYQADGTEKYIRVKASISASNAAWTQPVYFSGGSPSPTLPPSSPSPTSPPSAKDPDLNNDGKVNQSDMRQLLAVWGPISSSAPEDIDSNGKANSLDAGVIMANWGT